MELDEQMPPLTLRLPAALWWGWITDPSGCTVPCPSTELHDWCVDTLRSWRTLRLELRTSPNSTVSLPAIAFGSDADMLLFRLRWL